MPSLVEICQVGLEKIFKFHQHISLICFTWYEGTALHLNKLVYTLYQMVLYAKFGLNWPSSSGENNENGKRLQTDRLTDYAQQA